MHTVQSLDMLKYYKNQFVLYISEKNYSNHLKSMNKQRERIDPAKLEWTPPKFLPNQLRFL
jgi:histone acetyltransferase HTATIP